MVAQYHGDNRDLASLRRRFPTSSRGASLKNLIIIADQLGFNTRALRTDISSLSSLAQPAVLHWDLNHFVVLASIRGRRNGKCYRILDPARGELELTRDELGEHYTGVALEALPATRFRRHAKPERLKLSQLWTKMRGVVPALGRILLLSLIMQVVVLATPFYMQLAVDTALPASDIEFLTLIALGFGLLLCFNALVTAVRGRLVLNLSAELGLQTAVNLFRHTIFLPVTWFEKRHLGDVVSRFSSLQPITDLLSRGLVSSVVDGMLAITTLILMLIYSPMLTSVVLFIAGLYAFLKLVFFRSMMYANSNVLTAQAVESTAFMENMRGIQTIKMFCQEGNRQRLWHTKRVDYVVGSLKLGRITSGFDSVNGLVVALENILFIYLSIRMVLAGTFSLGMVFAFQAYKQSFTSAVIRLIDQVVNYKLLDVHLSRISDLALEKPEPDVLIESVDPIENIEIRDVCYSYGVGHPNVLQGISFTLAASDSVAIVGRSGEGKTTLLKILCGLLEPTSGQILVNGIPLKEYGVRSYRSQLGVVLQDDTLFSGSLAENISFFDQDYDPEHVSSCADLAGVKGEIINMPMKFDTLVGDMGSSLSGGQRQRILLARALYRKPQTLFMDEGTSNLDVALEKKVISALEGVGIGRIFVAHRPDAIASAARVIRLVRGTNQISLT